MVLFTTVPPIARFFHHAFGASSPPALLLRTSSIETEDKKIRDPRRLRLSLSNDEIKRERGTPYIHLRRRFHLLNDPK